MFIAQAVRLLHITVHKGFFDVLYEFCHVSSAFCPADGKPTFKAEYQYCQKQCLDYRYDDAPFVDGSQQVAWKRVIGRVSVHKVRRVAEDVFEQQAGYDETENDYYRSRSYACE